MKKLVPFTFLVFSICFSPAIYAQFGEPELVENEPPLSLFEEGYRAGFGFNIALNDFGFGAGGEFRLGLSPYTEAVINLKVAGLKDPTEQTFVDYFGGRIIPEKYKRVVSFPLYIGLKKRFFAASISDNFRLFSSLSAGPVFALSYAYFDDTNENGFRENDAQVYGRNERVYDIFLGWDETDTHWGVGGQLIVGVDFGENFANLSSVQFGYTMNYFADGIQILEPCQPDLERLGSAPRNPCSSGANSVSVFLNDGSTIEAPLESANDPRKYFGSAQISFTFGWMW
ncbi:MAG: hypothetical protein WD059_12275 [Balneolaceae bacterium]